MFKTPGFHGPVFPPAALTAGLSGVPTSERAGRRVSLAVVSASWTRQTTQPRVGLLSAGLQQWFPPTGGFYPRGSLAVSRDILVGGTEVEVGVLLASSE